MGYGLSYYDLKLISGLGLVLSEILGVLEKVVRVVFFLLRRVAGKGK